MKLKFFKNDMKEITKYEGKIKPASFVNGIQREGQTIIIVNMIQDCIKNEKRITIDEILDCWFKAPQRQFIIDWTEAGWKQYDPYDRVNILKHCRQKAEQRAKQWFMNNLGAAIIKGKLLVIPVIELPSSNVDGK